MTHMHNEVTGARLPSALHFHFVARLAVLLHPLAVAAFAWLAPTSITGRMLLGTGAFYPRVILLAMTALALLGLLDAVVNDLLPERWSLHCMRRNRHLGYMLLGATMLMQVFAVVDNLPAGGHVLIAYHLACSFVCGLFAAAATARPSYAL